MILVSECFQVLVIQFRVFPNFSNFGFRVLSILVFACFRVFPRVSVFPCSRPGQLNDWFIPYHSISAVREQSGWDLALVETAWGITHKFEIRLQIDVIYFDKNDTENPDIGIRNCYAYFVHPGVIKIFTFDQQCSIQSYWLTDAYKKALDRALLMFIFELVL